MVPNSLGHTHSFREERIHAVIADCLSRRAGGQGLSDQDLIAEHPDLMPELGERLAALSAGEHDRKVHPSTDAEQQAPADHSGPDDPEREASDDKTIATQSKPPASELSEPIPGYRIVRKLSEGGQGVVYLAIQESTQAKVAVKMMREGPFASRADKARFDREVQILARLNHPSIVAIRDSGAAMGGHYFVMDYISGLPLDEHMRSPDAPASIEETLRLFEKMSSAVNAAHLAGIIHRDLKPSNIRLDNVGEPHILDFGLAKVPSSASEASMMTMTGQFIGSLPWASPEQAEGTPDKIDMRTDVYSLGIILYQMLTGQFPYDVTGGMRDILDQVLQTTPRKPREIRKEIDDEVETIVLKCLNKERARRYQSAGELARDCRHYLDGLPIEAKRDSFGYVMRKQLMRRKGPVTIGVSFLIVILMGLVVSLTLWQRAVTEGSNARFRLEAARVEASKSFGEYLSILKSLRRSEEIVSLLPKGAHKDHPATTYSDATEWIMELFPFDSDVTDGSGVVGLTQEVRDAIQACTERPWHPRSELAFPWLRANQDRIRRLEEATRQHRFDFGPTLEGGPLLTIALPNLSYGRFAASVLTANALLHHEEGNPGTAIENLRAAVRMSRYIGDGLTAISTLVEIACRDMSYDMIRWIMVDAAAQGTVPTSYLLFIQQEPPFPDFRHASLGEIRMIRQALAEAFVKTRDGLPARLDLGRLHGIIGLLTDDDPYEAPTEEMYADAATLDYDEAVSVFTRIWTRLLLEENATFRGIHAEGQRIEEELVEGYPALVPLMPTLTRALEMRRLAQMNRDATVIVAALVAYRQLHGAWPERIDEALSSFEQEPLCRNYYGHDFVYRIVAGSPLLYVVGANEIDEGGRGYRYESRPDDGAGAGADDLLFLLPPGWSGAVAGESEVDL